MAPMAKNFDKLAATEDIIFATPKPKASDIDHHVTEEPDEMEFTQDLTSTIAKV